MEKHARNYFKHYVIGSNLRPILKSCQYFWLCESVYRAKSVGYWNSNTAYVAQID